MRRTPVAIQLLSIMALFGLFGCQQKGIGISTYDKGQPPILAKATADGEYFLYPENSSDPKVSYYLKQGDPLGFKLGQTGQIVAVAGTNEIAVPDANYVWKRNDGTPGK